MAHVLERATRLIKDLMSSVWFPSISGNLGSGEGSVQVRGKERESEVVLCDLLANGAGAGSV